MERQPCRLLLWREWYYPKPEEELPHRNESIKQVVWKNTEEVLDKKWKNFRDTIETPSGAFTVTFDVEKLSRNQNGDIIYLELKIKDPQNKLLGKFTVSLDKYEFQVFHDGPTGIEYRVVKNMRIKRITKIDKGNKGPRYKNHSGDDINSFSYFRYYLGDDIVDRMRKSLKNAILYFSLSQKE